MLKWFIDGLTKNYVNKGQRQLKLSAMRLLVKT